MEKVIYKETQKVNRYGWIYVSAKVVKLLGLNKLDPVDVLVVEKDNGEKYCLIYKPKR